MTKYYDPEDKPWILLEIILTLLAVICLLLGVGALIGELFLD